MPDAVIVDTDILIAVGREDNEAATCLNQIEQRSSLAVSVVTYMELLVGCRNTRELRSLEGFLGRFQIIKMNDLICDTAVGLLKRYRLSHGLLIADSLIAATSMVLDLPLITKNQRDYRFIKGLHLLSYPHSSI